MFVVWFASEGYVIRANTTSSLPERWWFINTNITTGFKAGEYFSFYAPDDAMLTKGPTTPLVKYIKGVAGDKITIVDHGIYINGKAVGHIWNKTSKGHKLYAIESQIIAPGCYFAWTPALYSYDSRYTDIGIVCEKDHRIYGSASPLF